MQLIPDDLEDEKERIQETIDMILVFLEEKEVKPSTAFSSINYIMFYMLDTLFTDKARKNIAKEIAQRLEEYFFNEEDNNRHS